jgi:hypothetical protein
VSLKFRLTNYKSVSVLKEEDMFKKLVSLLIVVSFLLIGSAVIAASSAHAFNPQPEPPVKQMKSIQQDIKLFQQEIEISNKKWGATKVGANPMLAKSSYKKMMNLLRSLQEKAKALPETGGKEKGIIDDGQKKGIIINSKGMIDDNGKLDSLLNKYKDALERKDKKAALGLLNEMSETLKAMMSKTK